MQDIAHDILIQASKGDVDSFELIYKAAAGFVYNVAFRVIGNRQDAEEITQEVFLVIYHKLKYFRFQASFKTWIYRITMNRAINRYKKNLRERGGMVEYDETVCPVIVPHEIENKINQEQCEDTVISLLKSLNPDQKACIVLRNIEGLSYQEIAEALKININTVRSRLKRARESLIALGKEVVKNEL
ncbi:MAG: RNA polymerase sigma factor [Candidatus Omnitrophica bacterium]|nr:RNA polymerase sigma factor [Candidatus Omnitrophota bacterium]